MYLQVPDIDPSGTPFDGIISSKDFGLEPRQVIDSNAVLLSANSDKNVLTFQNLHLLEATT